MAGDSVVGSDKGVPVSGPLEVRVAPLRRTMGRVLLIVVPSMLWMLRPQDSLFMVGSVVFFGVLYALLILVSIGTFLTLRAKGCVIRLDDSGVTLHGERTVAWSELASVRRLKKYPDALAFVPRSQVPELPPAPSGLLSRRPDRRRERLTRRYGTPLVVFTRFYSASADEVAAAVERFGGGVPVIREEV
ncbi:hypothetical protein [Actinacidiphila acidipaludis]|uniref:PH domain-containing protein n=1 Tax=Actinacidiphila acidipaludis TaxID=2873382 RepID=A0ABS7QF54_9ACTN|nr:hypothetical protein [Streptomyces acidipaludis]MBY8880577.1 hypothetical protein [Streptomyces acidipaludis]